MQGYEIKWFQLDAWLQCEGEFDAEGMWHGYLAVGKRSKTSSRKTGLWKLLTANLHLLSDVNIGSGYV